MRYFLGEIYITHKKTWLGWVKFNQKYSTSLIEAKDWLTTKELYNNHAAKIMANDAPNYRYRTFVSNPVR